MQDYDARNEHELTVKLDDLLEVLDDSRPWWRVVDRQGYCCCVKLETGGLLPFCDPRLS